MTSRTRRKPQDPHDIRDKNNPKLEIVRGDAVPSTVLSDSVSPHLPHELPNQNSHMDELGIAA